MKGINVHIMNGEGFTPEEQAKALQAFREKIVALQVAGNLDPELAIAIQEGKSFGIMMRHPGPMTEAEIELMNSMHSFECEPPIPTNLTITFTFHGGPWSHAQKYERRKEIIKYLEDRLAEKPLPEGLAELPPIHAVVIMAAPGKGDHPDNAIKISIDDRELSDDTALLFCTHEDDALPLKMQCVSSLMEFRDNWHGSASLH